MTTHPEPVRLADLVGLPRQALDALTLRGLATAAGVLDAADDFARFSFVRAAGTRGQVAALLRDATRGRLDDAEVAAAADLIVTAYVRSVIDAHVGRAA